jgi:hypothetical protein
MLFTPHFSTDRVTEAYVIRCRILGGILLKLKYLVGIEWLEYTVMFLIRNPTTTFSEGHLISPDILRSIRENPACPALPHTY